MRFNEFLIEGITHLEDLPVDEFVKSVKNIHLYDISEKIDGSNLHFGLDEAGKFYTSREGKGGKRFYSYSDWGKKFFETGFKSAHLALEKIASKLKGKNLLKPGDQIEVEILFGELPNTVPYKGETNQIIILRPISSAEGVEDLDNRLKKIKQATEGINVRVKVEDAPYTEDGRTVGYAPEVHNWTVSQTPQIPKELVDQEALKTRLSEQLDQLEDFLHEKSGIGEFSNAEILGLPLNRTPEGIDKKEWGQIKDLIKTKKSEIVAKVQGMKLGIKEDLLDKMVRKIGSEFGPEEGSWVEGLVFRDPETNEQFKLVDKDLFTAMNKFNWKVRGLIKTAAPNAKAPDVGGRMIKSMADVINIPELGRPRTIKSFLKKLKDAGQDPINFIASRIDFDDTKEKWLETIEYHQRLLERFLKWYEDNREKLAFTAHGKESKYSGEVDRRTLQSFAELNKEVEELKNSVKQAKDSSDLANAFVGEKLNTLGESRLITEGGNAFEGVGSIAIDEIKPTLLHIADALGTTYAEIKDSTLGSVGKAKFSGDIDVAMEDIPDEEKAEYVQRLEKRFGPENVRKFPTLVSVKYPIQEYNPNLQTSKPRTGYVQVDLIFGDREWLKFSYHSPGDKSKYKGIHRNLMLTAIAKNMKSKASEETDSFGRPVKVERMMWSPQKGLVRIIRTSEKDKKGNWKKTQKTEIIGEPLKDPKLIAKLMFGPNAAPAVFDRLETLVEAVKKYHPNKADEIFQDYFESLPEAVRDYDFPPEIEKFKEK